MSVLSLGLGIRLVRALVMLKNTGIKNTKEVRLAMMKQISKQSTLHKNVSAHFNLGQKFAIALLWFALLLTGLLSWQSASALSLGKLQVLSEANAPLQITIKIEEDNPGEAEGAAISIASPEDFAKNNRQYTPLLAGLAFSASRNADDELFLRISSENPLPQEPLDLVLVLIEKDSTLKRFYQYTFDITTPANAQLLQNNENTPKPPTLNQPSVPKVAAAMGATPAKPKAKPKALPNTSAPKQNEAAIVGMKVKPKAPATQDKTSGVLVVQPGDSMSQIASENLAPGASLNRMLAALYFNNLQAFPERNIHLIRSGQKINLPSTAQVQATTQEQITDVVQMLSEDFNQHRQKLAQQSQALPKTEASQDAKGKVSALEVTDPLAQAPDKLTLSATKDNAAASTDTVDNKTEAAALAQQKQADQDQTRQVELEQNVRDLQALDSGSQDSTQDSTGVSPEQETTPTEDDIAVAVPVPTPSIETVAPSNLESKEHGSWLRWWPYAVAAVVLLLVLFSLLRLLRSSRDNSPQGFVEDPPDSTSFVPPPSTDNTTMPKNEEQDPLKFSVSNQHFDLSALDLDLNDPPPYKKANPQNRDPE